MSDEIMEIEESFADMLERSIKTLNTGDKVTGVITGITPTEIYVDLGTKHAGYIPVSELTDDPTAKVEDLVKVGDEIETFVVRVNDQEGVVTLSKKRLDVVKGWEDDGGRPVKSETVHGGRRHRGQQGRRCGVRKGRAGLRSRLPDRPAPGDSHVRAC